MFKDLKIKTINKNNKYYPAYDIPEKVQNIVTKSNKNVRSRRTDLKQGQVVVVLEGRFASMRVIFLKQIDQYNALCCGPESINNVPFFKIDERYLFGTSVFVNVNEEIDLDVSRVFQSTVEDSGDENIECQDGKMATLSGIIDKEISKVGCMKRYLSTPFSVPEGKDFYSMKF